MSVLFPKFYLKAINICKITTFFLNLDMARMFLKHKIEKDAEINFKCSKNYINDFKIIWRPSCPPSWISQNDNDAAVLPNFSDMSHVPVINSVII